MEAESKHGLAVVKLIWALRYEAPKARLSGRWFYFPKRGWAVRAAERLFVSLGHPIGRENEVKLRLEQDYVSILHLSGDRPLMAVIVPEDGDKLVLWTRGAKIVTPYDHVYVELYALLWKRMLRRKKSNRNTRLNDVCKAVHYYWLSWQSLSDGRPFDPPPGGGWPHVPPPFF